MMQQTMLALDQKVKDFAIHVGLNNIIARDTSPKVRILVFLCIDCFRLVMTCPFFFSLMFAQVDERAPMENCTPSRRAQTPTERVKYQIWPNLRKADAALRAHTPDIAEIRRSPLREGAPNTRRKISVPELGHPNTVPTKHMDSRKNTLVSHMIRRHFNGFDG